METLQQSEAGGGEVQDDFAGDLEDLKNSFSQLRSDVNDLLHNAVQAGQSGAATAVDGIKGGLSELKSKSAQSAGALGRQVEQYPLASALIALGTGFVLARLFARK